MLKAEGIFKSYGALNILNGVSLSIKKGEIVAIVGASGAGKSTLLHILGTLDKADKGSLIIDKVDLSKMSESQLSDFRNRKIGFVFQFHHLLPEFTALENVMIPALIQNTNEKVAKEKALMWLDRLGMSHRASHKPHTLSGGEQQRVAIARALINEPAVVLADEPSGNLDSANAESLHRLIKDLNEEFQQTFIIVTHNDELAKISDRIITMKDGNITETPIN